MTIGTYLLFFSVENILNLCLCNIGFDKNVNEEKQV